VIVLVLVVVVVVSATAAAAWAPEATGLAEAEDFMALGDVEGAGVEVAAGDTVGGTRGVREG